MARKKKESGLGADAFFASPAPASEEIQGTLPEDTAAKVKVKAKSASKPVSDGEPYKRHSFNLKVSTIQLLDNIQIKTMQDRNKMTLSAIVERGIELAAKEMGVSE